MRTKYQPLTTKELQGEAYQKGLQDALTTVFRILGTENSSLITEEVFWYYYKKCVKEKLI